MKACALNVLGHDGTFHWINVEMKGKQHQDYPNDCCYPKVYVFEKFF
jgi:hypothetical protein